MPKISLVEYRLDLKNKYLMHTSYMSDDDELDKKNLRLMIQWNSQIIEMVDSL